MSKLHTDAVARLESFRVLKLTTRLEIHLKKVILKISRILGPQYFQSGDVIYIKLVGNENLA